MLTKYGVRPEMKAVNKVTKSGKIKNKQRQMHN